MNIAEKPEYKLEMEISIGDKQVSLNYKKFLLLKYIDKYGSIMKASKKTGIPYRTALKNIEIMEERLGSTIIATQRGGKGGGGASSVTKVGKQLLWEYIKLTSILEKHSEVNEIKGKITGIYEKKRVMNVDIEGKTVVIPLDRDFKVHDEVLVLISPDDIFVTLETHESSVRNVFEGKIIGMELKNEMIRLTVELNNTKIYVDVTEYSREKLGLTLGMDVFIAFKAASATIVKI